MIRTAVFAVATAALALAFAGPAGAKELTSARACDADGCRTLTSKGALLTLQEEQAPTVAPERRAPFHRVRMTITIEKGDEFHFIEAYVPALGLVGQRQQDTGAYMWLKPSPRALRIFERLTRGLQPVPARRLRGIATETAQAGTATPASQPPPADGGGSGPWWLLVLSPALVVAAGAAWAVRRRRPRLHPTPGST